MTVSHRYDSAAGCREVDAYFTEELLNEDTALVAARESSVRTTMPDAVVAANRGAFLGLLTKIAGARRVLEFGTLAGYSTIWFARAVGPAGMVVSLDLEERNAAVARANLAHAEVLDRVEVIIGPAATSAQALIDAGTRPFDLVFIDADKPSNRAYLDAALRLTRPGGVIVIDDVVRDGAVAAPDTGDPGVEGVRAVTDGGDRCRRRARATAFQPVGVKGWDGLIVARRT